MVALIAAGGDLVLAKTRFACIPSLISLLHFSLSSRDSSSALSVVLAGVGFCTPHRVSQEFFLPEKRSHHYDPPTTNHPNEAFFPPFTNLTTHTILRNGQDLVSPDDIRNALDDLFPAPGRVDLEIRKDVQELGKFGVDGGGEENGEAIELLSRVPR
jgi:hypothetical protein